MRFRISQNIRNSKTRTAWWWSSCLTGYGGKSVESITPRTHQMNLPLMKFIKAWTQRSAGNWWTNQRSSSSRPVEEVSSDWFLTAITIILRLITSCSCDGLQSCCALKVHQLFFSRTWVTIGDWQSAVGRWYGWNADTRVRNRLGGRRDAICAQRKRFHLSLFLHSRYACLCCFCLLGLSPFETSSNEPVFRKDEKYYYCADYYFIDAAYQAFHFCKRVRTGEQLMKENLQIY